uniref:Uncharacterized protein n=1 Tax=Arundo donax TaxID=35708 RepID=A0A0A9AF42_ARUDO
MIYDVVELQSIPSSLEGSMPSAYSMHVHVYV